MQSAGSHGGESQHAAQPSAARPRRSAPQRPPSAPSTFEHPRPDLTPGASGRGPAQDADAAFPFPQLGQVTTGTQSSASQPAPAHTLGIRAAAARAATATATAARVPAARPSAPAARDERAAPAGREPTLTARIRAVQPPDVARQAISELGVIARELAALPDALEESGLARTHSAAYFSAVDDYQRLARLAWEAVAEERLEQSGADPEYRQRAILVARRIGQLQQECRAATQNDQFQLPRRRPAFWRRRIRLVRSGLRAFQERLTPTPDPLPMGRGLFLLRGSLGLAASGGLGLFLLDLLVGGTLTLLAIATLGLVLLLAGALAAGIAAATSPVPALAAGTLAGIVAWGTALRLGVAGGAPLVLLLGAATAAPTRTTRNGPPGSALVAGLLRAWWLLVGFVGVLAAVAALAAGGYLAATTYLLPQPDAATSPLTVAGAALSLVVGPAALVALAALFLLAAPALLVAAARAAAELAGSPSWVPAARRYALAPALAILAPVTGALLFGAWFAASAAGLQGTTLASAQLGDLALALTPRAVALFAALALPYLLLLELPFRLGIRRWRRTWLADLAARRADVESHVRRLSAADPKSGAQDTSDENLRAMQYDLVLLQFYRDKIAEADKVPSAPFAPLAAPLALLIAAAAAVFLDAGLTNLLHLVIK